MPRILFVATLFSPLSARWITQLADTDWDVHVFGTQSEINKLFAAANITFHVTRSVSANFDAHIVRWRDLWPHATRGRWRLKTVAPRLARLLIREPYEQLRSVIDAVRPDIIHSLKMQDEGYLVHEALSATPVHKRPAWIYSVWGSDIFSNLGSPSHMARIRAALAEIDYLMADNPRDVKLALDNSFNGQVMGVFPTGGGYPIELMRQFVTVQPSRRDVIAVKGYQSDRGGQVLNALEGLRKCGRSLGGFRIIIHSAIDTYASSRISEVRHLAYLLSSDCGVDVEFLPLSPPEAIWKLFARSRVALALSKSDGTPNAMLEAMCVGAYPIQSDTGGLETWIDHDNGMLVPFDDLDAICDAVKTALSSDRIVDTAAQKNYSITEERLNRDAIRKQVLDIYSTIVIDRERLKCHR